MIINKKLTRKTTKIHNRRLTLKTIYDHQEISRADVARLTRLAWPTVSSAVAELIEEGLVEETRQGPSAGGKPPIYLRVAPTSRSLIGVDRVSDAFRGGVLDLRGKLLSSSSLPVNDQDGELALELAYALIDQLLHQFAPTSEAIDLPAIQQAFLAGDEGVQRIIGDVGRFLGTQRYHGRGRHSPG